MNQEECPLLAVDKQRIKGNSKVSHYFQEDFNLFRNIYYFDYELIDFTRIKV